MASDYQRGRSGRPAARIRALVKREGTHVCCFCGQPIDMTLHHYDKMSWTMEHRIHLSERPDLWNDLSNILEAHRSCNSRHHNKAYVECNGTQQW